MTDYKAKYQEAKQLIRVQKHTINMQARKIDRLLSKLADKTLQVKYEGLQLQRNQKQKISELQKTIRQLRKVMSEQEERIAHFNDILDNFDKIGGVYKPTTKSSFSSASITAPNSQFYQYKYVSVHTATILGCGIDKLYLRPNLMQILTDGGIETIYNLVTTPKQSLRSLPGMTIDRLRKISDKLKTMNLTLEMPIQYLAEIDKYIELK